MGKETYYVKWYGMQSRLQSPESVCWQFILASYERRAQGSHSDHAHTSSSDSWGAFFPLCHMLLLHAHILAVALPRFR